MTAPQQELLDIFRRFWFTWAERSRKEETLDDLGQFFDAEITAFGSGAHEMGKDLNLVLANFRDDLREIKDGFDLKFTYERGRVLSPDSGMVEAEGFVELVVDSEVLTFHLRFSTVFIKRAGNWLIVHNHVSIPASGQDLGEAYPLDELRARNNELRRLVEDRTSQLAEQSKLLHQEKDHAVQLLYNILPKKVAHELIASGEIKPQRYDDVSVIFTDFKEFTNIAASIPAKRLVAELNEIFSAFDEITVQNGLEKVKTIGDSYMAVSGLPEEDEAHAIKCVASAQQMVEYINDRNADGSIKWNMRVGIHSGPVVAGVVGKQKFTYDLWGDTVNLASRVERTGEAGRINISAYTYDLVRKHYNCAYRGKVPIKGKGEIDMYFVDGAM